MKSTIPQRLASICLLLAICLLQSVTLAGVAKPASVLTRIIVKPTLALANLQAELNEHPDLAISVERRMSGNAWVLNVPATDVKAITSILQQLQHRDLIDYWQTDASTFVTANPDDRLFQAQWQNQSFADKAAAMDLVNAWDITTGSDDIVVAVIDTGIRFEHADLTDRLLQGYDFVSAINNTAEIMLPVPAAYSFVKSNDGDGRDPDPTDPGDGVTAELHQQMTELGIDCPETNSTWHGTAMTSLLAANGNDGFGIAGIDWRARILPVRAIGRCGGNRSDLLDAIRWAAGVDDPALPPNPTPARIINLSLGIDDICGPADQRAINDAVAAGAIIVAAVGNQGRNLDRQAASPSDCEQVIGVTAVNASGELALYSNYGLDVDIAAPGGEGIEGDDQPILVASNGGEFEPMPSSPHKYTTGTSVASPLVAGVLSLMLSVNPELTNIELEALLYTSARRFPRYRRGQDCASRTCGAGMLDAFAAVLLAERSLSTPVKDLSTLAQNDPGFNPGPGAALAGGSGGGCAIGSGSAPDPSWLILLAGVYVLTRRRPSKLIVTPAQSVAVADLQSTSAANISRNKAVA